MNDFLHESLTPCFSPTSGNIGPWLVCFSKPAYCGPSPALATEMQQEVRYVKIFQVPPRHACSASGRICWLPLHPAAFCLAVFSLRFADGSCGQNLREVFAWSMSRRLMSGQGKPRICSRKWLRQTQRSCCTIAFVPWMFGSVQFYCLNLTFYLYRSFGFIFKPLLAILPQPVIFQGSHTQENSSRTVLRPGGG